MSGTLIQPTPTTELESKRRSDDRRAQVVCVLLVVAVALVFGQTLNYGFSNLDDGLYVRDEPHVTAGLSWSGLHWAFTNGPAGELYPLTMLSHMLDCQLYGLHPTGHHLTNLLLHAASAVTLFLVLWRMTRELGHDTLWPSALVAALFAIHPLHVESVAWISERRDVLSGLLFMLTLAAYDEYVRRPQSLSRYLAVIGLFTLGLLAKPMLVTLPALLLLLDFWPLGRFDRTSSGGAGPASFPWRVVVEKLPLFALSIGAAVATLLTHKDDPNLLTMPERLANGAISYVAYLGQLFVPVGLSIFYAHPEADRPVWQVAAAVALLLAITVAAVISRRSYPYFLVGWFWYVGMLVPVIGLVHVGPHARADRYTYLSQIGLYLALVWGAMRLSELWPARRWVFGLGSALMLTSLMACAWHQVGYWEEFDTLWKHALALDPKNPMAHYSLGLGSINKKSNFATEEFNRLLELGPNDRNIYAAIRAAAHNGLASIAARKGDHAGAIEHYRQSLEMVPDYASAHVHLGSLLAKNGDFENAILHLRRSVELEPDGGETFFELALELAEQGKTDEAIANFRKAFQINSDLSVAQLELATLVAQRREIESEVARLRQAIEIDADVALPYYQIATLLRKQGNMREADEYDERGQQADRRWSEKQNLRGIELTRQGRIDEAIERFKSTLSVLPDDVPTHANLADALASQAKFNEAIEHYRQALEIDPSFAPAKAGLDKLLNR
jgi:protein O-mannosyl-transferase